jgi:hypothetical protein
VLSPDCARRRRRCAVPDARRRSIGATSPPQRRRKRHGARQSARLRRPDGATARAPGDHAPAIRRGMDLTGRGRRPARLARRLRRSARHPALGSDGGSRGCLALARDACARRLVSTARPSCVLESPGPGARPAVSGRGTPGRERLRGPGRPDSGGGLAPGRRLAGRFRSRPARPSERLCREPGAWPGDPGWSTIRKRRRAGIESSTGAVARRLNGQTRRMSSQPCGVASARSPSRTRTVVVAESNTAGPFSSMPGAMASRS